VSALGAISVFVVVREPPRRRPLHRQPVGAAGVIPRRFQQFYPVPIYTGGDAMNWDANGVVNEE